MVRDWLTLARWRRRRRLTRALSKLDRLDRGNVRRSVLLVPRPCSAVLSMVLAGGLVLHVGYVRVAEPAVIELASHLSWPPGAGSDRGHYRFLMTQRGDRTQPVAYDPCRPVEYQVNDTLAPPGTDELVEEAVDAVGQATGLRFVDAGTTTLVPSPGLTVVPRRSPVVIAWTTPEVVPRLGGRVVGLGGSHVLGHAPDGVLRYGSGQVFLDAPQLTEVLAGPDGRAEVRAIVMHELAHVVGLAHVKDPFELMADRNTGQLDFGPGDLRGLAALGAGACQP